MKKTLTLLFWLFLTCSFAFGQSVYLDQFDETDAGFTGGAGSYAFSEANGELTITATNTGMWDVFTYELNDAAAALDLDITANNKLFIRVKASSVGTQFRVDLEDAAGYASTAASFTETLTTEYRDLEFDFTGLLTDQGYGGTACEPGTGPCPMDGTMISQLVMFTDPGVGGFTGSVIIDYIAFGEAPATEIMSDVYQEHFDQDSSINNFIYIGGGQTLNVDVDNSELTITGDGTSPQWDPVTYIFRSPTFDTIDIDASGNNKMYVKMKASEEGTTFRMDLQDIDGYVTTDGSITKVLTTEYKTYEFDFTGVFNDLGYGGTPCNSDTAPCPVNAERIANIVMFINPSDVNFLGEVMIDYISFDIPLEPLGPGGELIYEDHFGNNTVEFTGDPGAGLVSTEMGTEWTITGDGTGGSYNAVSYLLHDKETGEQIYVDMGPAQNKLFLKVKTSGANIPVRVDLLDTTGYVTSIDELTRVAGPDYTVLTYEYSSYMDGGFGGAPCEVGPCPVDPTAITQVLVYPDPVAGAFAGEIIIDFLSIGQPAGEDSGPTGEINYQDQMDDNTALFISDNGGLVSSVTGDIWTVTGDGTSGAYAAISYNLHNDLGEMIMGDVMGSQNVIYIRAKASEDLRLRMDLEDNQGFVTNQSAPSNDVTTEWAVFEYNYEGRYLDGGFGGPCDPANAPCPVDGQRVNSLQFFVNDDPGGFNGTLDIDWISFGSPLVGVQDVSRLSSLFAFPNPVHDQLRMEYDMVRAANVQLNVFNSMGQLVLSQQEGQLTNGKQQATMDMSRLTNGIYVVQVVADGASAGTLRLLKQ